MVGCKCVGYDTKLIYWLYLINRYRHDNILYQFSIKRLDGRTDDERRRHKRTEQAHTGTHADALELKVWDHHM